MTTKYDDEILELSTQWISMDEIVKDHNEDKQNIIQAVNRLENMGYLESRNIKNIISMDTLNSIIETLRDLFIEYFQNIEAVFHKTKYSFKIFMLNKMADTIQTRIICPQIH